MQTKKKKKKEEAMLECILSNQCKNRRKKPAVNKSKKLELVQM